MAVGHGATPNREGATAVASDSSPRASRSFDGAVAIFDEVQEEPPGMAYHTFQDFEEILDVKLSRVYKMIKVVSESSDARLNTLEQRLEVGLGDLDMRLEDARAERRSSAEEVRRELEAQRARLLDVAVFMGGGNCSDSILVTSTRDAKVLQAQVQKQRHAHLQPDALWSTDCEDTSALALDARTLRDQLDVEQKSLMSQIQQTSVDVDLIRTQTVDLVEALRTQHEGYFQELRTQVSDLCSVVEAGASRKAIDAVRARLVEVVADIEAVRNQCGMEMDALRSQCISTTDGQSQVLGEFEIIREQFIESIKALQRQHTATSGEIALLRSHKAATSALEATAMEGHKAMESALGITRSEVQALQTEYEGLVEALKRHEDALAALRADGSQRALAMAHLQEEHRGLGESLWRQGEKLENEVAAERQRCGDAFAALRANGSQHALAIARLQVEHRGLGESLQGQRGKLESELAMERKRSTDAAAMHGRLSEDIEALRSWQNAGCGGMEALQSRHGVAIEALRSQEGHLADAHGQLQSDMASVKHQLVETTKALSEQRAEAKGEATELRAALEVLKGRTEQQGDQLKAHVEAQLEATAMGRREEAYGHLEALQALRREHDRSCGALGALQEELQGLMDAHDSHGERLEALQSEAPRRRQEAEVLVEQHRLEIENLLEERLRQMRQGSLLQRCGLGL